VFTEHCASSKEDRNVKRIGRRIAYGIALLLAAAGVVFLLDAYRYHRDFYRWQEARPVDIPVDLSQPGEFTATFLQTCRISHGEALCLVLPHERVAGTTWPSQLSNLRFLCRILDMDGKEKMREELTDELPCGDGLLEGTIPLVWFAPFGNGTYEMTFTVTQGAPALRGVPQRLIGRYWLCGLEMRVAVGLMIMGIAAMLVAAVVAGITAMVVFVRKLEEKPDGSSPREIQQTPPADLA
jgi:hypothetical protein